MVRTKMDAKKQTSLLLELVRALEGIAILPQVLNVLLPLCFFDTPPREVIRWKIFLQLCKILLGAGLLVLRAVNSYCKHVIYV